ncbi:hypothetical protein FQA39_LY12083 [Lamprigera yunnana]|nr:hypothetical protein FQA39_LY12083 [Lamprigera yunnana]
MSCGVHLDQSLDMMEETRFKRKHIKLIKKLSKELHFTYTEMEQILLIYYKIQKRGIEKAPGITKVQLREVLHTAFDMTDVELTNDVVMSMVRGPSPYVPMNKFARIIALLLKGTLEEKINHCFEVYDVMLKGLIGKDIVVRFLGNSIIGIEEDSDDAVKDLVDTIMKKIDLDRDLKISFGDYKTTVLKEPLLMECMGQCLPSRTAVHNVLTTMFPKPPKM